MLRGHKGLLWGDWIKVVGVLVLVVGVRSVVGDEDDGLWEEWGETEESMKEAELRRAMRRGTTGEKIQAPPNVDQKLLDEALAREQSKSKMVFVKLVKGAVANKQEAENLGGKWVSMIRNGRIEAQVFPLDEKQIIVQYVQADLEALKRFLFSQPEVASIHIDGKDIGPDGKVVPKGDDDDDDDDDYEEEDQDDQDEDQDDEL